MAFPYILKFIPTDYVHPKTMTGKGFGVDTSHYRWALGNPSAFTSRVVSGNREIVDYYIIYSIQQIASPKGLAWLSYRHFGNKQDRDLWVSEIREHFKPTSQSGIYEAQAGRVLQKPFHGGSGGTNIIETLNAISQFPKDRIDVSSGLFLKGKEALHSINERIGRAYAGGMDDEGKIYGGAVIIIDNKQGSNLVTWEMQAQPKKKALLRMAV